jgi:large subunit ribosomal protein L29
MKANKLRELTDEELQQQFRDTQDELVNLQIRKGIRQLEKPSQIRTLRRNLARILTIMNERAQAQVAR